MLKEAEDMMPSKAIKDWNSPEASAFRCDSPDLRSFFKEFQSARLYKARIIDFLNFHSMSHVTAVNVLQTKK